MTISREHYGEDNIARLNAFLNQYPDGCDPDFDDEADDIDRQLAGLRLTFGNRDEGAGV